VTSVDMPRRAAMPPPHDIEMRERLTRRWMAAEPAIRAFVAAALRSVSDREDVVQQLAPTVARRVEEYSEGRSFVSWVL